MSPALELVRSDVYNLTVYRDVLVQHQLTGATRRDNAKRYTDVVETRFEQRPTWLFTGGDTEVTPLPCGTGSRTAFGCRTCTFTFCFSISWTAYFLLLTTATAMQSREDIFSCECLTQTRKSFIEATGSLGLGPV
jgi:hypothetical protein